MSEIFNLNRFWKFVKTETLINKNMIIKHILGLLVLFLFSYYIIENFFFGGITPEEVKMVEMYVWNPDMLIALLHCFIALIPFFYYINLYDSIKSVRYAMLPASQLEKVISAIIQTSVIIPALLIAVFGLFLLVIRLTNTFEIGLEWGEFFKNVFTEIQVQSFLFLGVFWFKKNKVLKIILSLLVSFTLLMLLGIFLGNNNSLLTSVNDFLNNFSDFFEFLSNNIRIIVSILIPLLPWFISYKKYVRTQV